MSWLFCISKNDANRHLTIPFPDDTPLFTFSNGTLWLTGGGNPDTVFSENETETSPGWAVVGVGFAQTNTETRLLTQADWRGLLMQESFDPVLLDGHFVAMRWRSGRLECYTDQLGIRTLYFGKSTFGVCISTRLDWLGRSVKGVEVDYASLGGRWLLFNQFSFRSGISGVERLGPGGYAAFDHGTPVRSSLHTRWVPTFEPSTPERAIGTLDRFVRCALSQRDKPSLGLSGGLDSRFLLSVFLHVSKDGFATHTFGDCCDPDLQIAHRIAMTLGFPHRQFNEPLPHISTCLSGLRSFLAQGALSEPASSYLKLRYYSRLRANGNFMVDGGFGEIARRKFFNRLVKLGKRALLKRNLVRLARLLSSPRAGIFSADVNSLLEEGAIRELEQTLDELPEVSKIGPENFADLLAISARLPNYVCHEQARIDSEVINFMPFLQPSYLREVFGLPMELRSGGGLHKTFIRDFTPALTRFPLSKGGITHRYGMSDEFAWMISKVKSQLGNKYIDPKPDLLLTHLREFVLDTVQSKGVAENPVYDHHKISDSVMRYFAGDSGRRSEVDWWLTFELWRQSLLPPGN